MDALPSPVPPSHPTTVESALARYRETGDARAFAEVFDATSAELFHVALSLLDDPATAEDAVQETYISALAAIERFESGRRVMPWLVGILQHQILHARRGARRRTATVRAAVEHGGGEPADVSNETHDSDGARAAIEALDEPYRSVALLRWRYGLEPAEIAHVRGEPPGTTRSILSRALDRLKRSMSGVALALGFDRAPRGLDDVRGVVMQAVESASGGGTTLEEAIVAKRFWIAATVLLLMLAGGFSIWFHGHGAPEARAGDPPIPPGPAPIPTQGRTPTDSSPECAPNPANPGTLTLDLRSDTLDLGATRQGETLERDIVVRNTGSGLLCILEKPRTGCGCLLAEWVGDMRLLPNRTGILRLRIDTKGREGLIEKDVTIVSSDPARREVVIHVKFDVRLGVLVAKSPSVAAGSVVYFGRHAPGRPGTAVVRLKSPKSDADWNVTAVEGTKTKFAWTFASAKPVESDDPMYRQFDLTVTHPGAHTLDLNDESLKVVTTHPGRPEILLHSQLLVAPTYYTSPPTVKFGFVGGTSDVVTPPRVVTVFPGEQGEAFTVTKAEIEGAGFTVGLPVDRGADGWQVEVRYDGQKRASGPVNAMLRLHIADPSHPRLEIKLHADVRD